MPNCNGKVIMHTLMTLKEPATMTQIVSILAESAQVSPNVVKPEVLETLEQGVRYGFIKRYRGRYFVEAQDEAFDETIRRSLSQDDSETGFGPAPAKPQQSRSRAN